MSLPGGEKNSMIHTAVSTQYNNVTYGRTNRNPTSNIALSAYWRSVKTVLKDADGS